MGFRVIGVTAFIAIQILQKVRLAVQKIQIALHLLRWVGCRQQARIGAQMQKTPRQGGPPLVSGSLGEPSGFGVGAALTERPINEEMSNGTGAHPFSLGFAAILA